MNRGVPLRDALVRYGYIHGKRHTVSAEVGEPIRPIFPSRAAIDTAWRN